MPPARVTTRPSPTRRRSDRFCFALPRWAIGAAVLPRVDEGGEVGHVQGHRAGVQPEPLGHGQRQLLLDSGQRVDRHGVHRVPEPPVVQRRGRDLGEPVRRGGAARHSPSGALPLSSMTSGSTAKWSPRNPQKWQGTRSVDRTVSAMPADTRLTTRPEATYGYLRKWPLTCGFTL